MCTADAEHLAACTVKCPKTHLDLAFILHPHSSRITTAEQPGHGGRLCSATCLDKCGLGGESHLIQVPQTQMATHEHCQKPEKVEVRWPFANLLFEQSLHQHVTWRMMSGLGFSFHGLGFSFQGSGFRVQARVQGLGFRV
jgi:hypothetical protein